MRRFLAGLAVCAAIFAAAVVILRILYPLPDLAGRQDTTAIPASTDTAIGAAVQAQAQAHPGTSGIYPLGDGIDAFAARTALIRGAQVSIDAQYYIWQDDLTGISLLSELTEAARRGVRVRLLVDDNGTPALDQELLALSAMPAAEVRFFNPFVLRDPRALNYAFDFFRLNRRMHNKSFTVDGAATIVGGRNIGDIYFAAGAAHVYADLDVLALGPAAVEVADDFDRYWNSRSSFPAEGLIAAEFGGDTRLAERVAALGSSPQAKSYADAVRSSRLLASIANRSLPVEWSATRLFSDDPAKGLGQVEDGDLMIRRVMDAVGTPRRSFDLISAYFVPGENATARLAEMAGAGVRIRTLTNALEATDVTPVHAGYIGYRDALVDAGIEVWELKSDSGERKTFEDIEVTGISRTALHAKTFAIDGERAFVGSFNFDPRSKRLNCEMGLLIDSPNLARLIAGWLDENLPRQAYRVRRDMSGDLVWTDAPGSAEERVWTTEPNTTWPLRATVWLIGLLPIEWLL